MSEELNIHVVGSFTRTLLMRQLFVPQYRLYLEAKVTDASRSPNQQLRRKRTEYETAIF